MYNYKVVASQIIQSHLSKSPTAPSSRRNWAVSLLRCLVVHFLSHLDPKILKTADPRALTRTAARCHWNWGMGMTDRSDSDRSGWNSWMEVTELRQRVVHFENHRCLQDLRIEKNRSGNRTTRGILEGRGYLLGPPMVARSL